MFTYSFKTSQPITADTAAEAIEQLYRDLSIFNKEIVQIRRLSMTHNKHFGITTVSITFN